MDWQVPVTAVLVLAASAWSLWTLMPAALRGHCLRLLGRPAAAPAAAGACGSCNGCAAAPGPALKLKFVRRLPGD